MILGVVLEWNFKKIICIARHQWLTPVILAIQEAEIRRTEVRSQPGQIDHKTQHKKGLVEWFMV
jgi:hypothetical protein